ncbi:hypothetical protein B296_00011973 [Ensete ventricosum]|uniref:Uncharacterized protein n=1 Tax=Ensete ventricosum TaxID=4639 RepID=A0A426XR77_ENSVE|nr:hypothetical protein B296_00011973 [Ensete ventricosum]
MITHRRFFVGSSGRYSLLLTLSPRRSYLRDKDNCGAARLEMRGERIRMIAGAGYAYYRVHDEASRGVADQDLET